MSGISSISEFLLEAGTEYRIVDMGRGFHLLDSQTFLDIENGKTAPLHPRQQMIWLGVLFWNKHLSQQQYIWFIKLPLDEQGLVVSAQRDQFLQIILEALGTEMLQSEEEKSIPDNPFLFQPSQPQIADFNSLARSLLNLGPGQYYQNAKNYMARPDINNWQEIALQGISDVACNLGLDHNAKHIVDNFTQFAPEVQDSLLASLENQILPEELDEFLLTQFKACDIHSALFNPLLRSLTKSQNKIALSQNLKAVFQQSLSTQDNLLVIAGRHWQLLEDYSMLTLFCEEAARLGIFAQLYADLVQIPTLRDSVLQRLRDPQRSEILAQGINQLFGRS